MFRRGKLGQVLYYVQVPAISEHVGHIPGTVSFRLFTLLLWQASTLSRDTYMSLITRVEVKLSRYG